MNPCELYVTGVKMAEKFKRQPNFSGEEIEMLIKGVERRASILFSSFSSFVTAASKEKSWTEVAAEVTAVSGVSRNVADVKKKWSALKTSAKASASANRRESGKTGGGPRGAPDVTEQEVRIAGIVGEEAFNGIVGGFDTADCPVTGKVNFTAESTEGLSDMKCCRSA